MSLSVGKLNKHKGESMKYRRRRHGPLPDFDSQSTALIADMPEELNAYCIKWTLRALVDLGGHKSVLHEDYCSEPHLIFSLDLGYSQDDEYEYKLVLSSLKKKHREVVNGSLPSLPQSNMVRNINWLAKEVGLNDVELEILLFCVIERQHSLLRQTMASLGEMSTDRAVTTLSVLLEIPPQQVYQALSTDSTLIRSGLICLDQNNIFDFSNKVELINGITERINGDTDNPLDIFSDNFVVAPSADLSLNDFGYLGSKVSYLAKYLKHAISKGNKGVNVLVYGVPGSGKTQLARAIAQEVGANLFEVAVEDRDGDRIVGSSRMSAYRLSQRILSKREGSLLVFDEIEDINSASRQDDSIFSGKRGNRSGHKGWMNHLLEQNAVPSIWITNNVQFLDPAHLRRFDLHLHVEIPPLSVRSGMLQSMTKELNVTNLWCDSVAANESLSPALISRAAKVAGVIYAECDSVPGSVIMDSVVGAALSVQNQAFMRPVVDTMNVTYDLDVVNSDCNLSQLIEGLRHSSAGRICLYGPPGTGKSAFAQYVAKTLDKPVVLKRASDILAPFVGETEARMATMFHEAYEKDAVLILDEADSFLRSRDGAQRNWEVSMVNEMLTQMESFQGIFFCTTNLMTQLDEASMRRFDLKANFQYLRAEQTAKMFKDVCQKLGFDSSELALKAASQLGQMTPGDFSNAVRQSRLNPIRDSVDLLERLRNEMGYKKSHDTRAIGFLANAA